MLWNHYHRLRKKIQSHDKYRIMYVCSCVPMSVCICVHMCKGWSLILSMVLYVLHSLFWDIVLHWNRTLPVSYDVLTLSSRNHFVSLSVHWDYRLVLLSLTFTCVQGIQTEVLMFVQQTLYSLSNLPTPQHWILIATIEISITNWIQDLLR